MFALKCEHIRFLQDFIVWPICPQTEKSRTRLRDQNGSSKIDRNVSAKKKNRTHRPYHYANCLPSQSRSLLAFANANRYTLSLTWRYLTVPCCQVLLHKLFLFYKHETWLDNFLAVGEWRLQMFQAHRFEKYVTKFINPFKSGVCNARD